MLDILGFKDYINTAPDNEIYETFNKLTKIVEEQLELSIEFGEGDNFLDVGIDKVQHLNYIIISDTIILWTESTNILSLNKLLKAVKKIINESISINLLLRGAIVYDDIFVFYNKKDTDTLTVDASVVGKGIINAYNLSEKQDWVGCIISDDVILNHKKQISIFENKHKELDLKKGEFIIHNYLKHVIIYDNIPLKNEITSGFVIQWVKFTYASTKITQSIIEKSFRHYKDYKGQSAVRIKLINTKDFISHVNNAKYKNTSQRGLSSYFKNK